MAIDTYLSTNDSEKKIKQQNRNRLLDAENILTVARWEGVEGYEWKADGIKQHKLLVTEQSWGCKDNLGSIVHNLGTVYVSGGYWIRQDDHLVGYIISNRWGARLKLM